ncbi:MAG: PHP domain-containing protein [Mycoplasma sp.]
MKIDLHLHSPASSSNGDAIAFKSIHDTLSKLLKAGVKAAAFTDHNTFDHKFYTEAKKLAMTGKIILFPGIEVDVIRKNGEHAHMLIIFNETLEINKLLEISNIAKNKLWKCGISLNEINLLFSEFETIRIIHIGKGDYFHHSDLVDLKYDAFEITNLMHPNYISVIKHGFESSIVSFSDTHCWDVYPQLKDLETIIDVDNEINFKKLKEILKHKKNYVQKRRE